MQQNPFKPTAGRNPPILVGRDSVLDEFVEGIENGPGAPSRLMRISGMRGMGKTVMLNEIGLRARQLKWGLIDETANPGFCERVLASASSGAHVSHLTVGPSLLGVSLGNMELDRASLSLRETLEHACKRLGGLLITLDEVQDASLDEMQALSVAIQHLIRDEQNIAFVFAGLPSMIDTIVNGQTLTFLRRAIPVELRPVDVREVALSLDDAMHASGMEIPEGVADTLADATRGYPFMIQLVGYHAWQQAKRADRHTITPDDAARGIAIARERFDRTVIEPALQRLPKTSLEYLLAMAEDTESTSSTSMVAKRMGKDPRQASPVRSRLIREDVIEASSWGRVSFAIPYMADYLRFHRDELLGEMEG